MKILLDTNVVLDALLRQPEWFQNSIAVWQSEMTICYASATSITDVFYIVRKRVDMKAAKAAVQVCLKDLIVLAVDAHLLMLASKMRGSDFEDNVQIACAQGAKLDAIVTRDEKGFKLAEMRVFTPSSLLAELARREE